MGCNVFNADVNTGWCKGEVGVIFPSTGVGEGKSDTGMFGDNMFSTNRGERGDTEGVVEGWTGPGQRNMVPGDGEVGGG